MQKYIIKIVYFLAESSRTFYKKYIIPNSTDEDVARREYIFNVLVMGLISLTTATFLVSFIRVITQNDSNHNLTPVALAVPVFLILLIYKLSRRYFNNQFIYGFIGLYLLMGTYGLYLYSYILPQGLLIYALIIVISGILISTKAAFMMTMIIAASLSTLSYLQKHKITYPKTEELNDPINANLAVYLFIFFSIYLVSWLSTREIEKSLLRARNSEKLLMKERDTLEIKVQKRTSQLEKAQLEKMKEVYRFAEFGRMSSSLLHDLANPLMAVSLNINQLKNDEKPRVIRQIRSGISHMEAYVRSARRQLNNQSDNKTFDCNDKINQVVGFLKPKAKRYKVKIKTSFSENTKLYGDSSKFSQIMANLITNAVDSYEGIETKKRHVSVVLILNKPKNYLEISVSDKGCGIPSKKLNKIFDPFFTTKSSNKSTGIGLTITKRIIKEDFGGKITVKSSKTKGTVFVVKLPLKLKRSKNNNKLNNTKPWNNNEP